MKRGSSSGDVGVLHAAVVCGFTETQLGGGSGSGGRQPFTRR